MLQLLKRILNREYRFLNKIEISRSNLIANYRYLSSLNPNFKIAPVLKSNAYGHGILEIAKILEKEQLPFYCVDSLHEAYELLRSGIKTPILIMGYFDPQNLKIKKLPFAYSLYDLNTAEILNDYQKGASVHIKVDTGMHRLGVLMEDLETFLKKLKKYQNIKVEGVMSHLAQADDPQNTLFQKQIVNFKKAKAIIQKYGFAPKWFHISATNALINPKIQTIIFEISNLARIGKALYGLSSPVDPHLKPVLKLTTKIAQIKLIKKGERIGYDGTYQSKNDLLIAVLPIGYNDGVDRRLSNKGVMLIDKIKCPIVGRVSMNITTIDISQVPKPYIGQEVVVYSDNPSDPNSIENSASTAETISHEILVHLVSSTKRVVV